jgi:hypothetical protein
VTTVDINELLKAKADAVAALETAEADLLDELESAKVEYRERRDDRSRERFATAVAAVRAYRAHVREGREGTAVAGDAFVSGTDPVATKVRKAVG